MYLAMIGVDFNTAKIQQRERASLSETYVKKALKIMKETKDVEGAVLISTCNRTEGYICTTRVFSDKELEKLFYRSINVEEGFFEGAFYVKRENTMVNYLFELTCGLHSMILGEDQIITQVNEAINTAIEEKTSCAEINTLFRHAVTCAKKAKTSFVLSTVSPSVATGAYEIVKDFIEENKKTRVLVIGNGKMSVLAAETFYAKGCDVTLTLRQYKYSENIIPSGCGAIAYDLRGEFLKQVDIVISATKSPHYTVDLQMLKELENPPKYIFDLALPRDIDPKIKELKNIKCFDIDDIGVNARKENKQELLEINKIILQQKTKFAEWKMFKQNAVLY